MFICEKAHLCNSYFECEHKEKHKPRLLDDDILDNDGKRCYCNAVKTDCSETNTNVICVKVSDD